MMPIGWNAVWQWKADGKRRLDGTEEDLKVSQGRYEESGLVPDTRGCNLRINKEEKSNEMNSFTQAHLEKRCFFAVYFSFGLLHHTEIATMCWFLSVRSCSCSLLRWYPLNSCSNWLIFCCTVGRDIRSFSATQTVALSESPNGFTAFYSLHRRLLLPRAASSKFLSVTNISFAWEARGFVISVNGSAVPSSTLCWLMTYVVICLLCLRILLATVLTN